MTDAVVIAIVGAIGAVIAGFFKLIDNQNRLHAKLSDSIDKMAGSSEKVAKATERGAKEAEQRNGHLAEMLIQQSDRVISSVTHIKEQKVKNQVVENETVKKKG